MKNEIAGGWCLREKIERKKDKKINPTEGPWAKVQAPMVGVFRVRELEKPKEGAR